MRDWYLDSDDDPAAQTFDSYEGWDDGAEGIYAYESTNDVANWWPEALDPEDDNEMALLWQAHNRCAHLMPCTT